MLNISGLDNGIVLDHIPAGMSMEIYKYLNLGKLDSQVAIIKNASSKKMGKKDIIKIAGGLDSIDLDVIGFLNHKITVNIITNGKISEKKTLHLPKKLTNVIHCKNPRCITSIEQELPNVFLLTDPETATYRCKYCEEKYTKYSHINIKGHTVSIHHRFGQCVLYLSAYPIFVSSGHSLYQHSRIHILCLRCI